MRHQITVLLLSVLLIAAASWGGNLAQVQVVDTWVDYKFGDQITFHAKVQSTVPIIKANIFFQAANDPQTNVGDPEIQSAGDGIYDLTYTHHLSDYTLRAFSQVDYRFEAVLEDGTEQKFFGNFLYQDNRFEWKELEEPPFRVFWYDGDIAFSQRVLDAAQKGLSNIQDLLQLPSPKNIEIYVYADSEAMQGTLHPTSNSWVAGHADPDLGVIVVTIPEGPERQMYIEQRIPHELMHILLFQESNLGYTNLPIWLNEGLATTVELYPNPDYRVVLNNARERGSLLPMASLCKAFPRDISNALLAYAQAGSFTRYLHDSYGITGMHDLITSYANGLDCERGAQTALGKGMKQLERAWLRDVLAENVILKAFNNLLPWLVLLATVLVAPLVLLIRKVRARPASLAAGSQATSE